MVYIIVEDLYFMKSKNKERDDYICFLLNTYFTNKNKCVYILSNDKFKNYNHIINNIKPVQLHFFNTNVNLDFQNELIKTVVNSNFNRLEFKFNKY